jgi:hypothetical protein
VNITPWTIHRRAGRRLFRPGPPALASEWSAGDVQVVIDFDDCLADVPGLAHVGLSSLAVRRQNLPLTSQFISQSGRRLFSFILAIQAAAAIGRRTQTLAA